MPSSATITSTDLTDFVPNTRIKSSEVDNNFGIWRGHIIPVDPNTSSAAATGTYDLGSSEYSWKNIYADFIPINISSKSSNYTATTSDRVLIFTSTATLSLPAASSSSGMILTIKNNGSGVVVTIDPNGSETIDGLPNAYLQENYETITIVCDGSNWFII